MGCNRLTLWYSRSRVPALGVQRGTCKMKMAQEECVSEHVDFVMYGQVMCICGSVMSWR